jgi:pimeloyl-ACP methyl ester carboxylesterase
MISSSPIRRSVLAAAAVTGAVGLALFAANSHAQTVPAVATAAVGADRPLRHSGNLHFDRNQTEEKTMKTLPSNASVSPLLAADSATAAPKPEIVLVHGAWEEANIWQTVTPLLKKDGYPVVTVTLPGRPSSPLSPDKVSLDLYRDTILNAIGNPAQPVVLVIKALPPSRNRRAPICSPWTAATNCARRSRT